LSSFFYLCYFPGSKDDDVDLDLTQFSFTNLSYLQEKNKNLIDKARKGQTLGSEKATTHSDSKKGPKIAQTTTTPSSNNQKSK
jgi:hypothetical protein